MNQTSILRFAALMLALSGVTAATAYATPRSLALPATNEVAGVAAGSALAAAGSSNKSRIGSGTGFGPTNGLPVRQGGDFHRRAARKILIAGALKATNTNLTGALMLCRWDCVLTPNANDLHPRIEI
jgi:hypothetical protein